ncbi:MAG: CinA family protein [Eubacteriales bacterium]|nr:CinA family protein [Eubacteriales bacterium]
MAAQLKLHNKSIAIAESLSGGLACSSLVSLPGISAYLKAGVVAYSEEAKASILAVDLDSLPERKVVSAKCAEAMLVGLEKLITTDLGLSLTGNAGPEASSGEAVGRVFIGARNGEKYLVREYNFSGNREEIRIKAVISAYRLILELLN